MTQCPECGSGNVEINEGECTDDGQGYSWAITYPCYCNECECEFFKIERTEVEYEVEKSGNTVEVEDD